MDVRDRAPYAYNIFVVDWDKGSRESYRNFVSGKTYCDVSSYDSAGTIRFDFFGDCELEQERSNALTHEEAAVEDWALVIDPEHPGYAHCGNKTYIWDSERQRAWRSIAGYIMRFELVEQ